MLMVFILFSGYNITTLTPQATESILSRHIKNKSKHSTKQNKTHYRALHEAIIQSNIRYTYIFKGGSPENMNLQQQKDIITLSKQYQDTDKDTIKANFRTYLNKFGLTSANIAKRLNISIQTIYQLRKQNSNYKPDFITALILCDLLQIPITAVMKPVTDLSIPEPRTKWSITAKQNFINDYNSLEVTALCKKYNLTPRTAQEYNRNFVAELAEVTEDI